MMAASNGVKETLAKLEQGVKDLYSSDRYAKYLKTMARFHKYSFRNTVLIFMQRPDASLVTGFRSWQTKFGRNVKKGEKAIKILAPAPFTIREEKEKLDPATKLPVLDENGLPVIEYLERQLARFKIVNVFDIDQTDGKPLPSLVQDLTGDVEQYEAFMDALKTVSPLQIVFEPMPDDQDGVCYFGDRIAIRTGMSEIQTVCAAIHEISHAKLHDLEQLRLGDENAMPKDRHTEEIESESIAYAVSSHFGIETGDNSFGYIATWSKNRELKELTASLETISRASAELIEAIDGEFKAILKDRNITIAVAEPISDEAKPTIEKGTDDPEPISAVTPGMVYAKYCNKVAEIVGNSEAYNKATANAGEADARASCESAVRYFVTVMHLESPEEHQDLHKLFTENEDFKGRLEDYVFMRTYLEPQTAKRDAEKALDEPIVKEIKVKTIDLSFPDPTISNTEMRSYGYAQDEMHPLSVGRAVELFDTDHTVYLLYNDNTESMAFDRDEIRNHDGLCGIERADWEMSPVRAAQLSVAANAENSRESELLHGDGNRFGIYQVKTGDETRDYRYVSIEEMQERGLNVLRGNYELVHTAPFEKRVEFLSDRYPVLNDIYETFNMAHPEGYAGRSVSISDVIVLKFNSDITSHYVDDIGFTEIDYFLGEEPVQLPQAKVPEAERHEDDTIIDNTASTPLIPTVAELEAEVKAGNSISLLDLSKAVNAERNYINRAGSAKSKPSLMQRLEDGKRKAAAQGQQEPQKTKETEVRS